MWPFKSYKILANNLEIEAKGYFNKMCNLEEENAELKQRISELEETLEGYKLLVEERKRAANLYLDRKIKVSATPLYHLVNYGNRE